jgi:hypothetical protein
MEQINGQQWNFVKDGLIFLFTSQLKHQQRIRTFKDHSFGFFFRLQVSSHAPDQTVWAKGDPS